MKYKVGDKILLKNINWYNRLKNNYNRIVQKDYFFDIIYDMVQYLGKEYIITEIDTFKNKTYYKLDNINYYFPDYCIELRVSKNTINKETKDKIWKSLPEELKELIIDYYNENLCEKFGSIIKLQDKSTYCLNMLEDLFGKDNIKPNTL